MSILSLKDKKILKIVILYNCFYKIQKQAKLNNIYRHCISDFSQGGWVYESLLKIFYILIWVMATEVATL